jgi:hypothetical protein
MLCPAPGTAPPAPAASPHPPLLHKPEYKERRHLKYSSVAFPFISSLWLVLLIIGDSDPDPNWIWIQSGQWIRIPTKMTHKNRKKLIHFMF